MSINWFFTVLHHFQKNAYSRKFFSISSVQKTWKLQKKPTFLNYKKGDFLKKMSAYVRPTNHCGMWMSNIIILSEIKETISNSFELLRYNWSRSRSFFGSSGSATLGENKKKIHIEPWELVLFEALNFCNTYHIWLWVCWCIVLRLSFSWAHDGLFFSRTHDSLSFSWAHDGLFNRAWNRK